MKTLFLGDIHGLDIWQQIEERENADRIIFVGDYFDSFSISGVEQIHNFKAICEFKRNSDKEVILLVGNHDLHYQQIQETYSGFQQTLQWDILIAIRENADLLQMAYAFDNILCSHAGVSQVWVEQTFGACDVDTLVDDINQLYKERPGAFRFSGIDVYGDDITQSPVWIRPYSLMKSNEGERNSIKNRFIQVFGHTQIQPHALKKMQKKLGGNYYMIDTLPYKQYLIKDEDGKFKQKTI